MQIGGIDPSLSGTGLCRLAVAPGPIFTYVWSATVRHPAKRSRGHKLREIALEVVGFGINHYPEPLVLAIMETPFKGKYASAVMALSEVRGAILSHWASAADLTPRPPLHDLDPRKVKQVITGQGNATKEQVALAVQRRLRMDHLLPENEADAAAIAMAWVLLHPETCTT